MQSSQCCKPIDCVEDTVKSSKCKPNYQVCVEVDMKSSQCPAGACVDVASNGGNSGGNCYEVRDTKDPNSPVLHFTKDEWVAFVLGVKAGEFDFDTAQDQLAAALISA